MQKMKEIGVDHPPLEHILEHFFKQDAAKGSKKKKR
jgi:hypothetical protein